MIFAKGHGTENDFVVLPDLGARLNLTVPVVSALCDRQRGLGADGVLRVITAGGAVSAGVLDRLPGGVADGDWYMDYRNADGSVAQMCGNGVRVFAHYLRASGVEDRDEFVVGTLAGPRPVVVHRADEYRAEVTVEMGKADTFGTGAATVGGRRLTGLAVDVGNPHLACLVPGLTESELAALDVAAAVGFVHAQFPDGVNVEVLTPARDGAVSMRHSRNGGRGRRCPGRPGCRHRNAAGADSRRRGRRRDHRSDQLSARTVDSGRPWRVVGGLVGRQLLTREGRDDFEVRDVVPA